MSAADDFEHIYEKLWKHSMYKSIISRKELKTLWQKDKLLDMNNLSFVHYVFKRSSAVAASENVCLYVGMG